MVLNPAAASALVSEASWRERWSAFEWGCLGVVALAFLVRVGFILHPTVIWDSAWYLLLARSFGETGTFYLPWSAPGQPEYSGYWPPLFPVFVAPLVKILGPSYQTLVLGSVLASAVLTVAVFFTTRDLFDERRAFAAMAIVAANPAFYVSDSKGMSESLLAFAVVMTVWAFLKSIERPVWLPVAGGFAVLAYLGKASLGLPFVAVGVVALGAWRVWRRGWRRVVTSPFDVGLALAGLAAFALLAMTRTERVGSIGLGLIEPLERAVLGADCSRFLPFEATGPQCWALLYPFKVAFVGAFLVVVTLPLSLRLRQALRASRSERSDALWLAVLLPLLAGAIFTTSFYFTEHREIVDFDNIRYLTPAMVPFLWLMLPHWPLGEPRTRVAEGAKLRRRHETWYGAAVGTMFVLMMLSPLAGRASLPRLVWFVVLSFVPLAIALVAYGTHYDVVERRTPRGLELRYVPARMPRPRALAVIAIVALLGISAWYFSAWYLTVGLGLIIALASMSPQARVVATALMLLGSAAPGIDARLPVEHAMEEGVATLPPGTTVWMSEQVVYPAGVAPGHVKIRLLHPELGIPPDAEALLMQHDHARREWDGFTRVGAWEYEYDASPTLTLRLAIEERMFGNKIEYGRVVGVGLFVRNDSALLELYSDV